MVGAVSSVNVEIASGSISDYATSEEHNSVQIFLPFSLEWHVPFLPGAVTNISLDVDA